MKCYINIMKCYILPTYLISLYTNLVLFFVTSKMFFTKSAATFGRTYAAHSDLPRKGIIFNIPALLCHDPLHVIVKITINNNILFTAFHITLVH